MRFSDLRNIIVFSSFMVMFFCGYSQSVPNGFNYQTTLRNASGTRLVNQSISIRFSVYSNSPTGVLIWQEDHVGTTDNFGAITKIIGTGSNTGAGISGAFSQINWGNAFYYLKVSIDVAGGTNFSDQGTSQLFSVPYSFYSKKTKSSDNFNLSNLNDVNILGNSPGKLLNWNGSFWYPGQDKDSDTVLFSVSAAHSILSDTANIVYGILTTDSLAFASQTDSSVYSDNSLNAFNSISSIHSDTALYSLTTSASGWEENGSSNTGLTRYIGTNDNSDIIFRSNNILRASLKNDGNFLIGTPANTSDLGISGNDGFLFSGNFGSGFNSVSGSGAKMLWEPTKGAFRAGAVTSYEWDSINVGNYSMATGFNTMARISSFSSGYQCRSVDYSIAIGRKSQATARGPYPQGNSMAFGDSCISNAIRSVTLGRKNFADTTVTSTGSSSVLIGYNNRTTSVVSACLGNNCFSSGVWSTAIGSYARITHISCFVFSDASSSLNTSTTANYQFMARASGGVVFYTDSLSTMGVTLAPGGGSWSSVSDINKKESFSKVDLEILLNKINLLKIQSWNYKSQPNYIRHIGPMAQDFYKLFGYGENNKTITSIDIDGVIISGIKGLNKRINNLSDLNNIDSLKSRLSIIDNSSELDKRLDKIEALLNKNNSKE